MNRFKKKSKLKFVTEENNKRRRLGYFFLGFLGFALILGTISLIMLLKAYNFDLSSIISGEKESTTQDETETIAEELSGEYNFLLIETSNNSEEIYLISIVNADMNNKKIKVCVIPEDAQLFNSDKHISIKEGFKKDGAKGVALELKDYGINISKYVCVKEKDLKSIVNILGGVVVDNEKSLDYKGEDFDLVLLRGEQTLKGDTAIKYLKYNWGSAESKREKQAYFICNLFDQTFTEKNLKKGESLFSNIVNLVDTNITAIDFGKAQSKIELFVKDKDRKKSEAIFNIDGLKRS